MPRLLSLFDGTGAISRPFIDSGIWDVDRLDTDGKFGANIICDVREWDYTKEKPYDIIFAGVPCEQYSICRTRAKSPRNYKLADSILECTINIIRHNIRENDKCQWFVENPATSHIWRRRQAEYFTNKVTLDFCQYGTPYRKRTTLATNTDFKPRPLCDPKYCPACPNGKSHDKSAQRGPCKGKSYKLDRCSLDELHAYPTDLCKDIYKYVSKELVWEIV